MHESLLMEYVEREAQMDTVYDGDTLKSTVRSIARRLGSGRLVLLSTTPQGAGVAAACAVTRSDPTAWRQIDLMLAPELPKGATPVFVEVVDPGEGWQDFVLARYPNAQFVFTENNAALKVA